MTVHKTFRDLDQHQRNLSEKLSPMVREFSQMTLEEVIFLQRQINHMVFLSFQQVEESITVKNGENVEESL